MDTTTEGFTLKSILEMSGGAYMERADVEMARILRNLMDINTPAKAKRKLVLTFEFWTNEDRLHIMKRFHADSKLAPLSPIEDMLFVYPGGRIVESTHQIPGQVDIEGNEQVKPVILKVLDRDSLPM